MTPAKSPPGTALHGLYDNLADFIASAYHRDSRADKVMEIQNAMSERVPADGGFLVPEEYREDLVEASLESAIVRPGAQVFPMRSFRLAVPGTDETTHVGSLLGGWIASWVEENTLLADTQAVLQRDVLEAKKLAAFTTIDNELFEDAAALEAFIRKTLPPAVAWYEDDGFINGTGQGEPKGVLTSNCAVNVSRGTGGSVLHADVVGMAKRMWPQGWPTACWMCGPDTLGALLDLYQVFGTGPTNAGQTNSPWLYFHPELKTWCLLGVRLTVTEHSPAIGSVGDLALVDCSAYVIGDREIMTIQISPHPKFQMDQSVIRVRHRVDGRMWPNSPVTPASGAATVSPVVVLN